MRRGPAPNHQKRQFPESQLRQNSLIARLVAVCLHWPQTAEHSTKPASHHHPAATHQRLRMTTAIIITTASPKSPPPPSDRAAL